MERPVDDAQPRDRPVEAVGGLVECLVAGGVRVQFPRVADRLAERVEARPVVRVRRVPVVADRFGLLQ